MQEALVERGQRLPVDVDLGVASQVGQTGGLRFPLALLAEAGLHLGAELVLEFANLVHRTTTPVGIDREGA